MNRRTWIVARITLLTTVLSPAFCHAQALQVGIVFDKGGKDDRSFNAAAFLGGSKAKKELGIELKTVEATDDNAFDSLLRAFAKKNYDLIIAVGIAQAGAVKKVSPEFPKTKFAIVDSEVSGPNVRSLLFQEHEGSYLVGAIAALKSKTGKIGFIGGMDIPLIRRFQLGYEAGARAIQPKIRVLSGYVGVTGTAWHDPTKAKEIALSQYQEGADVIFAAAGASNLGLFDAAEQKKKFAIGVDSNQNWIKPGLVLTSMLKRVDVAVFETIQDVQKDRFVSGVSRFGLANNGVAYAVDEHNQNLLSREILEQVEKIKAEILTGKRRVPDYYQTRGK